jgi:hypothetical protein
MNPTPGLVIWTFLVPLVLGAVIGVLALRARKHNGESNGAGPIIAGCGATLALTLGAISAHWGVFASISQPMRTSDGRMLVASGVVGVIALITGVAIITLNASRSKTLALVAIGGGVASLVAGVLVALSMIGPGGSAVLQTKLIAGALLFALGALSAGSLGAMSIHGARISTGAIFAGWMLATGAAVFGSGSVSTGQFGIGAGLGALGLFAAVALFRGASLRPTIAITASGLVATVLSSGYFIASTPLWLAAGIAMIPVAGLLAGFIASAVLGKRSRPWLIATAQIGAAAILAGALVAPGILSLLRLDQKSDEYEY